MVSLIVNLSVILCWIHRLGELLYIDPLDLFLVVALLLFDECF